MLPTIAIYRNQLFLRSEPFIADQATMLTRHRAIMVGWTTTVGSDLPAVDLSTVPAKTRLRHKVLRDPSPFVRLLSSERPVLIHAHFGVDAVYALPVAEALAVPMVTTLHGYDVSMSTRALLLSGSPSWVNYVLHRRELARRGALFVCVSEHVRRRALELGFPTERTEVHYIGVDTERFAPTGEVSEQLVLHVARLVEKKGTRHAIAAFQAVARAVPAARLVIIGDGPLRTSLQRQAVTLGIGDRVDFVGSMPREEVRRYLARSAVFCLPSVTAATGDAEGLPISIIEAMATGVPVVATRHAGAPEAVTDGQSGYIVDEADDGALAARLIALLQDSELRRRLGVAARLRAIADFDLRKNTEKLEARYMTAYSGAVSSLRSDLGRTAL
jgi:colanic acid/amylovoran biosynthesis glycosyltransferase